METVEELRLVSAAAERLLIVSPFHPSLRPGKLAEAVQLLNEVQDLDLVGSGFRSWQPMRVDGQPFVPADRQEYALVDVFLGGRRPVSAQPRVWGRTISLVDLDLQEASACCGFDKEPDSPTAFNIPFAPPTTNFHIRAPKYKVHFHRGPSNCPGSPP